MLAACKPQPPSQYLQPGEMEDLLVDYHISRAAAQQEPGRVDFKETMYFEAVLQKYGVSRADFDSSMVYYYTHADRFAPIYKRVVKRLEDEALALGASEGEIGKYASLDATGDTANIWNANPSVLLLPMPPYNRLDFCIDTDTLFRAGDSFMFQFMADFVYQGGTREGIALVSVTYDNDTVVTRTTPMNYAGLAKLEIHAVDTLKPKQVRGFLYLGGAAEKTTVMRQLFVSHLQLIRFHTKQEPKPEVAEVEDAENKEDSVARDTIARPDTVADERRGDTVRRGRRLLPAERGIAADRVDERLHRPSQR